MVVVTTPFWLWIYADDVNVLKLLCANMQFLRIQMWGNNLINADVE